LPLANFTNKMIHFEKIQLQSYMF